MGGSVSRLRKLEMHKSISASLDASLRVVDIDFAVQGARGGIDGIGVAHDGSLKCLAGKLIESQGGLGSGLRSLRINLRYSDIDAQLIYRRHKKKFLRDAACSSIDERSYI